MNTFIQWAPRAQRTLFEREVGPRLPFRCPHGADTPHHAHFAPEVEKCPPLESQPEGEQSLLVYRCLDCYNATSMCESCLVDKHKDNPFHRIEVWDRHLEFWQRESLGTLKSFVINLGHGREACPAQTRLRPMQIVHEHGIASMNVRFCACLLEGERQAAPDPLQVLRYGLFPGTWKQPDSAYTINGLRDYHLLTLQCQITGIDYTAYLRRSEDNVILDETPVSLNVPSDAVRC